MDKREIDKLVAENVMGWKTRKRYEINKRIYEYAFQNINHPDHIIWFELPEFSANIKDAWLVIEKFDYYHIEKFSGYGPDKYRCRLDTNETDGTYFPHYGVSDTVPMAICFAAIDAVGMEV